MILKLGEWRLEGQKFKVILSNIPSLGSQDMDRGS